MKKLMALVVLAAAITSINSTAFGWWFGGRSGCCQPVYYETCCPNYSYVDYSYPCCY